MIGVGPDGRTFMVLRERGRRKRARRMGGNNMVAGRMERRNDFALAQRHLAAEEGKPTANFREPQRRSITRKW